MSKKSIVIRVHPRLVDEIERVKAMHFEITGEILSTYEATAMIERPPIKYIPIEQKKYKKRGFFDY